MKSLTWSNISIIRLGQECLWRLCVILPVISARWTAISYFCMLPGGEKMPKLSCIAPLLQHPDVVNQRLNVVHVAVPKVTGRNEKSVCGVQSIHKHPTHPLKSDSALKKSNFVKQHIMRGAGGGGCWDREAVEPLGIPLLHLRTPSFTKDHPDVSYKTHH